MIESKSVVLAARGGGRVREVVRTHSKWWRDVVVEAARLAEGEEEGALGPLWARAEAFVDCFDEGLPIQDEALAVEDGALGCIEVVPTPQHDGLMRLPTLSYSSDHETAAV